MPIADVAEFTNPNVVKVVPDARGLALYFSRAPIPWWRDGFAAGIHALPAPAPLRHIGIYGYRAGFLRAFPALPPAPLETHAKRWSSCARCGTATASRCTSAARRPAPGVDTPEDLERVRAPVHAPRRSVSSAQGCVLSSSAQARRPGAETTWARSAPHFKTIRGHHETDFVGRARRGQRHAGHLHLPEVRHPADLHRRHAARRGQGRHAAGRGRPRRSWTPARLVSDDIIIGLVKERIAQPDCAKRLPVRRLPAHHPAGRRDEDRRRQARLRARDRRALRRHRRAHERPPLARGLGPHLPRQVQSAQGGGHRRRHRRAADPARRRQGRNGA